MPTKLNWTLVDTSARAISNDMGLSGPREAFAVLVLSNLLGISQVDALDAITDGSADQGIDALYFDERDDALTLNLFNFKYHDAFKKSDSSFPGVEIDKVTSFVSALTALKADLKRICNPLLRDKLDYVWDKIISPAFEIKVYLCSNGRNLNPIDYSKLQSFAKSYSFLKFTELDADAIAEQMIRVRDQRVDGEVQLTENQYFPRIDGNIRGLIATVRATDLVKLLENKDNPSEINKSAFNENIRLYLGSKNEVNRSIVETAIGDQNSEFWYLNNGITIVCERFKYNDVASPIVALTNFQVVNGGQTANALFEVARMASNKIRNVNVLVRIYEASGYDIKLKIAAATNNQTRINARDLKSNDPIQRRLEEALRTLGYFYERKKDQHQDKPAAQRIDALRAGQCYLAYYERQPDKAKTQSNRIFGEWYGRVFSSETTPQKLLCPVLLSLEIDKKKSVVLKSLRSGVYAGVENEFLVEGAFHVLYVVGLLCTKRGVNVDDLVQASALVDEAIGITRTVANQYRAKSFYKFFRSVEAKDMLFEHVFEIQRALL